MFLRMERKVSIRRAVATDADQAAAMFTAVMKQRTFAPKFHSDEEDRAYIAERITDDEMWVAVVDGRVIGLACLKDDCLMQLHVDPAQQNCGIGTALLDHVKYQRPGGFDLWTFQANKGARRFYERHGLEAVERTDGERNEEQLPDVRYAWLPVLEV